MYGYPMMSQPAEAKQRVLGLTTTMGACLGVLLLVEIIMALVRSGQHSDAFEDLGLPALGVVFETIVAAIFSIAIPLSVVACGYCAAVSNNQCLACLFCTFSWICAALFGFSVIMSLITIPISLGHSSHISCDLAAACPLSPGPSQAVVDCLVAIQDPEYQRQTQYGDPAMVQGQTCPPIGMFLGCNNAVSGPLLDLVIPEDPVNQCLPNSVFTALADQNSQSTGMTIFQVLMQMVIAGIMTALCCLGGLWGSQLNQELQNMGMNPYGGGVPMQPMYSQPMSQGF